MTPFPINTIYIKRRKRQVYLVHDIQLTKQGRERPEWISYPAIHHTSLEYPYFVLTSNKHHSLF